MMPLISGGGGLSASTTTTAQTGDATLGGFNFSPVKGIDPKWVIIGAVGIAALFLLSKKWK